jgi:hypothetical protein
MLMLSRILISFWNNTHIFSELWSPHAHFRGAWFVIAISLLSLLCLWLVWSPVTRRLNSSLHARTAAPRR